MNLLKAVAPLLILLVFAFPSRAQTDSVTQSKIIKPVKKNKDVTSPTSLQLVYEYVRYYDRKGLGGLERIPCVRIDSAKPIFIDRKASALDKYNYKCPLAVSNLNLYKKDMRHSRVSMYSGFGVGVVMAFSGLVAAVNSDNSGVFWTRFGIGAGVMLGGGIGSHLFHRRADKHLHDAFDAYNSKCYMPLPKDTTIKVVTDTSQPATTFKNEFKSKTATSKKRKDVSYFQIVRNAPEKMNIWGVTLLPAVFDVYALSPTYGVGGGVYYYFNNTRIKASYEAGLVSVNPLSYETGVPSWGSSHSVAEKVNKNRHAEISASFKLVGSRMESYYPMRIASRTGGMLMENVKADKIKALSLRMGFIQDRKVIQHSDGLPLTTDKAPIRLPSDNGSTATGDRWDLAKSSVMLQSQVVTAGISFSIFKDLKINLKDERYKGRKEYKALSDLYFDVLYAPVLKYDDVLYYHKISSSTEISELVPVTSPFDRLGARFGYRREVLGKVVGTVFDAELSLRPGPQLYDYGNAAAKISFGIILGQHH